MSLRVVAGTLGGRTLKTPKGDHLRPTQDRIKQAIFSSLGERVPHTRVLDLYAGTGALGIEALSRGATEALFVEKNPICARCINENLTTLQLTQIAKIKQQDTLHFLQQTPPHPFDLIFADPPYDKTIGHAAHTPLPAAVRPWLTPDGLFIWEFFSGQKLTESDLPQWKILLHRKYGETAIAILTPTP